MPCNTTEDRKRPATGTCHGLRRLVAFIGLVVALALPAIASTPAAAASLDLSAYRGKVVYLDFWASWCAPCRQSFPWMNTITDDFGSQGLVVIGVNVDHERNLAETFLRQNAADFHIVYDPDGQLAQKYNVEAMPTSILIGRDGKIRYVHSGFHANEEPKYLTQIRALLNQKAS